MITLILNCFIAFLATYLDIGDGPKPQHCVGPGGGSAQPDEGQHRGDDQVVLGVALLLVQVQVRVENVQGQAVRRESLITSQFKYKDLLTLQSYKARS